MKFENLRVRHHHFLVKAPPDYFVPKFNYLVSKSNSFNGCIRNGEFKGFVGLDFFPFAYFVTLMYTLTFRIEYKAGNTQLRVATALNPTLAWTALTVLLVMLIGFLYAVFVIKNTSLDAFLFFVLAPLLLGFYYWLIMRDSRKKCLDQLAAILFEIEATWAGQKPS